MNKPKDVHVGIYDAGKDEIKVWCVSFTIKGSLHRKDGKVDEAARKKKEKEISKIIEGLTFPEE